MSLARPPVLSQEICGSHAFIPSQQLIELIEAAIFIFSLWLDTGRSGNQPCTSPFTLSPLTTLFSRNHPQVIPAVPDVNATFTDRLWNSLGPLRKSWKPLVQAAWGKQFLRMPGILFWRTNPAWQRLQKQNNRTDTGNMWKWKQTEQDRRTRCEPNTVQKGKNRRL